MDAIDTGTETSATPAETASPAAPAVQKRKRGRPKRPPMSRKHQLGLLRRSVREQGLVRTVDARTAEGRAFIDKHRELLEDLGGEENLSAQRRMLVDMAMRTKLFLDSLDAWALEQPSIVNKRARKLYPFVLERTRLADSLQRQLEALGLDRVKVERALTVSEYVNGQVAR